MNRGEDLCVDSRKILANLDSLSELRISVCYNGCFYAIFVCFKMTYKICEDMFCMLTYLSQNQC